MDKKMDDKWTAPPLKGVAGLQKTELNQTELIQDHKSSQQDKGATGSYSNQGAQGSHINQGAHSSYTNQGATVSYSNQGTQGSYSNQGAQGSYSKSSQQDKGAHVVSAAKPHNSNDQTSGKTVHLHVQSEYAEMLKHFGFREHLNKEVPDAIVEFLPEDQKVQIFLKDPRTSEPKDLQKILEGFEGLIYGLSYNNPKLCLASFNEEQLDTLMKTITESVVTNCYFKFEGIQMKIYGLSKGDVLNTTQDISDLLEKNILRGKSTSRHSTTHKMGDVTIDVTDKLQEFIGKFRDEFNEHSLKSLPVGGQLVKVVTNQVTFHGVSTEKATDIVEKFVHRSRHSFKEKVGFLVYDKPRRYVDEQLARKGFKCCWSIERDDMHMEVLACTDDVVKKASMLIEKCVSHHSVPVPDEATRRMVRELLLNSDFNDSIWCEDINSKISSVYRISTTNDSLAIFMEKLDDKKRKEMQKHERSQVIREDVEMSLEVEKHLKQMQHDDVAQIGEKFDVKISSRQRGWEVKGHTEQKVKKAAGDLRLLGNKLQKTNIISASLKAKSLFGDESFLQQLQEKHRFCTIHPKHGCAIAEPRCPLEKYCWFFGPHRLIQAEGRISEAHADILFCPMNYLFHPVGVGNEIVHKAGTEVTKYVQKFSETDSEIFRNLKEGDIHFEQRTGFLKTHCIAFAVFPSNGGNTEKMIKKMYSKILDHANTHGYRTVAMPVILEDGTIKAFVKGIKHANKHLKQSFGESFRGQTVITELILVTTTGQETEELKLKLEKETKAKRCTDWRHVTPLSEDEKIRRSPIHIDIRDGSIVDKNIFKATDMIVNSVDSMLGFDAGVVSQRLLQWLGPSVKEECRKLRPNGICCGEVVTSQAGQFENKKVCHACMFPRWDLLNNISLKVLKCIMLKCLKEADIHNLRSVSFPALGTGTLKYLHKKVAETMTGCVEHYGKQHPNTNIEVVQFIIYKDTKVMQAFYDAQTRMLEIPYNLTLEGTPDDVLPYFECDNSNSTCLLRIVPKYPFEKMPLDIIFTLDAESTHLFSQINIHRDKILNRLEMSVSILQDLRQAVTSCLNFAISHGASTIAFAFKTAKVPKQEVDTIATTFLAHKTGGQISVCYILLEDMSANYMRKPSEARGQSAWALPSGLARYVPSWPSSEICWLQKEVMAADIFKEVHCLTVVSHASAQFKCLTAELEGYLHKPLEWVVEQDGKKTPASPEIAKELSEGYMHPSKRGFVPFQGKDYEFDFSTSNMLPVDASKSVSTVRIAIKVEQDPPEKKQMKTEPSLNDVFGDVTAQENPSLGKLLQTTEIVDAVKQMGLTASNQNGSYTYSGKMEDILRLDTVLRRSMERSQSASRGDPPTTHRSDSESSIGTVISIQMTNLEYLGVKFYMRQDSLWQKVSEHWDNGCLHIMADKISNKDANQLETKINANLDSLKSISWGELIVEDQFKDKVEDGIKEVGQNDDFKNVFYHFNEETRTVHIFSRNYNDITKAKHKIGLVIGAVKVSNRRERRFDLGPSQVLLEARSSSDIGKSFRDSQNTGSPHFPTLDTSVFQTSEGLVVKVYSGSILHLNVDCIVNAANGDLQHGGGVAYVISNAAGYEFERESRDYVYNHGPLKVGEVCTTTAGRLKYEGVIHAVGPRWNDYGHDQKLVCLADLQTAVKESLMEANSQQFKSIAIPAISSGIFGVPKELCAKQYYQAVEEYSRTRGSHSTLTEVHFIDKDTQMCRLIQTTFSNCFGARTSSSGMATGGLVAGSSQARNQFSASFSNPLTQSHNMPQVQRSRSLSSDEGHSANDSGNSFTETDHVKNKSQRGPISKDSKIQYQIGNNLTVHVVCGNIIEADTDAIVNPENKLFDGRGRIARAIKDTAGEKYGEDLASLNLQPTMTEVLETSTGDSKWKCVLHVVAPRWDRDAVKDNQTYEKNLKQSYENILRHMDKLQLNTLAMPVLGTGAQGFTTPYNTIAKVILSVSKQFADRVHNRKDVYVCCTDMTLLSPIRDVFDKEFREDELPGADQKNLTLPRQTEDKQVAVEVTEDCCICIDTMTEPKKLSCGHVFCTDCIDQQFKYKPACPQCGSVHGKITGDQPPGTMTMNTLKSFGRTSSLPGYQGFNIISITYNFPSGNQGPDHPTPGRHYQGISRPAYLPDNEKGRLVAKLLRIAFDRKLVFTIGRSRTTGHDGVVTWNDIHHKTRMDGGPQAFGYPDPTYLDRVLDELKAKGVTEDSLNDP